MKIRSIWRDGERVCEVNGDVMVIGGGYGSWRSEALRLVPEIWMAGIGKGRRVEGTTANWRFDVEVGASIERAEVIGGEVRGPKGLEGLTEMTAAGHRRYADDCVLFYNSMTMWADVGLKTGNFGGSSASIAAVLRDIHTHRVRRSVVVIDDFDAYLTDLEAEEVFRHVHGVLRAGGNQLLVGSRGVYLKGAAEGNAAEASGSRSLVADLLQSFVGRKNEKR